MITRQLPYLLGLSLICQIPLAKAAYTSPAGLWDVFGRATIAGVFPDHKTKTASNVSTYKFIQFKEDGTYTTIPWQTTPGKWEKQPSKTKYKISFDPAKVSNAHLPPFLLDLLSQFRGLAEKKYGKSPTVTDIKVTSFSDSGQLQNKGLNLYGTNKIKAVISYDEPVTNKPVKAQVRLNMNYQGVRASAPSTCCTSNDPARNKRDSQAFITDNAKLAGVKTTKSGLQYRMLSPGKGAKPKATSKVTVYYRGILPNGEQFDSNFSRASGTSFDVNKVIPGFAEGLQLMPKNGYFRFYIPPNLGYGETGSSPNIKPNSALIFDVQLEKIE